MTTVAEMAGGLLLLAAQGLILWGLFELGSKIFFKIREREGKAKDYCQDCGQVEWLCICE